MSDQTWSLNTHDKHCKLLSTKKLTPFYRPHFNSLDFKFSIISSLDFNFPNFYGPDFYRPNINGPDFNCFDFPSDD